MASFSKALELGLDGVELDARTCKTGEVVVFHDDSVSKVTDGSGLVSDLTFDQIKELDAGIRFEQRFKGERIPMLKEVLQLLGGKMVVNIELKTKSIRDDGLEAKVVAIVQKMQLRASVILSSFNPFSVWRVAKLDRSLKTALLFADDQPIHLRRAWGSYFIEFDGIHPRYPLVDDKLMKRARDHGWYVCAWTVDAQVMARSLAEKGVDIIITNHPARTREALAL